MFETIPKIRIFINLLLIIEICLGLAIIAVTWYHQRLLAAFLTDTEGIMLSSKFFNAYILGFQLFASFLCGLSMWANIWPRRYSENLQLLLSVWLVYCFLIVACGGATIWALLASAGALSEEAEMVLLRGIDNYYMKPEWKFLWDKLQYTKECCGVNNYQDWMQASWMSESNKRYRDVMFEVQQYDVCSTTTECSPLYYDYGNSDKETLENQPVNKIPTTKPYGNDNLLDGQQILAPYACCKHDSVSCYANYMPHIKRSSDTNHLPHLNLTDINTNGCILLFTRYLRIAMNTLFILILLAIVIDILICCLTKYLMATNFSRCYREFNNDSCMFDDDGNALVVIKCPPKVRCITLEEPNAYSGSDIPNIASSNDICPCCNGSHENVADPEDSSKTKKKNNSHIVH